MSDQLQADCALIHLKAAQDMSYPPAIAREIQIAIDRLEDRWDSVAYEWERDEANWERRNTTAECYQHDHRSNGLGGGTCQCGDEVKAGEL